MKKIVGETSISLEIQEDNLNLPMFLVIAEGIH